MLTTERRDLEKNLAHSRSSWRDVREYEWNVDGRTTISRVIKVDLRAEGNLNSRFSEVG